jgi:hypothetical protein
LRVAARLPQVLHPVQTEEEKRMSDQQAPYEAPSVEQIDTDGEPIHTSPGQVGS